MKKLLNYFYRLLRCFLIAVVLTAAGYYVYDKNFSDEAMQKMVRDMYSKIVANSGVTEIAPYIVFTPDKSINAATNGFYIYVNKGLIDNLSRDEIALVLGHELAHVHLEHTQRNIYKTDISGQYYEAMADKLGAFYMMRAGYDVCKGREFWKRMRTEYGNRIKTNHPNHSYRYDELNIGCE